MHRLTRKEERLLRRTGDGVRMYVALLTFVAPLLCVRAAGKHYAPGVQTTDIPEIPDISTWGNIAGIYLPLFGAVAAYVWATRAAPNRNLAPNGLAMALFRDAFTVVVLTVMLLAPWLLYRTERRIVDVHPFLVWYQTVLTAVVGGAFAYYFHGRVSIGKPEEGRAGAASADAPKRKAPRRRKPAPAAPDAAAPEPASTSATGDG